MAIGVQIGREIGINLQTTGKRIGIGIGITWWGEMEWEY